MRVLFWADLFWPYVGGIQVWSARLLPALMPRGYEFGVVTSHGMLELPDTDVYKGIRIFRLPFWAVPGEGRIDRLAELHRRVRDLTRDFRPDLLHVNVTGPVAYFCLQAAQACPARLLVSYHHPLPSRAAVAETVVGHLLAQADWVTCLTAMGWDEIRGLMPGLASRSSVITHGMEPPALAPAPLPVDAPRLLCLGRLAREKGFDLAVEAFAAVARRHPRARLVIASNGSARSALAAQAARLGVSDRVDFLGGVPFEEVPALLNSSTIVLMPSRYPEGFGLVALEAALMARPIIAARAGALEEVVVDGQTGLLVEREDPSALAGAITRLLAHPDEAAALGERSRVSALARFGWTAHVDAFDDLYRRLARLRQAGRFERGRGRVPLGS